MSKKEGKGNQANQYELTPENAAIVLKAAEHVGDADLKEFLTSKAGKDKPVTLHGGQIDAARSALHVYVAVDGGAQAILNDLQSKKTHGEEST